MKKLIIFLFLFVANVQNLEAANIYLSATAVGGSDESGSSVANAINCSTESALRTQLQTGGNEYRVLNGASGAVATYPTATASLALIAASTSIIGWDRDSNTANSDAADVVFTGSDPTTFDVSSPTSVTTYGFRAVDDADNITLKNFTIKYFRFNIDFGSKTGNSIAPNNAKHTGTVVSNVISEFCEVGFSFAGDKILNQGYDSISSINATNDTITVSLARSWTFANNDPIGFIGVTIPTGLSKQTTYFVRDYSAGTFKVAATALGTACSFVLSNIQNPTTAGSTGTYKIETYTTADVLIDDDLAVTSDTITSPPSGTNPFKISGCRLVGVKVS